ncbi:hypothetical protein C2869_04900 [Saccharobesus litoralis]|uniref:Gfo/Idh/MocA-like oxidoreductase N-terminal domain-containing protein n=1 Tax=Saccharobesus litoralis TaxID=2172099 RepID=A0A2S0VNM0_9ALTE|nr:Gfo/Idh/MocA family oxidoreductase [Saccharobesus litoralis]AWB65818.1 hypothetical protein C2869_04900 [Saccharobesus litoralis]
MKVGLIGSNWGRIHIGTFAKNDLDIAVLVGKNLQKCQKIAKLENIPLASTDLHALDDADLLIIASPADTHLDIIQHFPQKAIWCEKPVSLSSVDSDAIDFQSFARCYVNYAFPHLRSVQQCTDIIRSGQLGRVKSIIMKSSFDLPGEKAFKDWFTDIVVHPFAYISHLFGAFDLKMAYQMPDHNHITAVFTTERVQLDISFYRSHEPSMLYDITFVGEKGDLQLKGGYRPYSNWFFDPVKLNGIPQNSGEFSTEEDIWLQANTEAVRLYLATIRGQITTKEAKAAGLFNLERAVAMEKALIDFAKFNQG